MSKKKPRVRATALLRMWAEPAAPAPADDEIGQKLLPLSTICRYLTATRGYGPKPGESPLDAAAEQLCARERLERGHKSARRFVEQHRAIVRAVAGGAPGRVAAAPQPAHAAARAAREAIRPPKAVAPEIAASDAFLESYEWRRVRMQALKKYGARCQCCGASPATGAVMNVDHIKPRRLFPQLALDLDNLQVLCGECNHGKGNWDMTDWRVTEGSKP